MKTPQQQAEEMANKMAASWYDFEPNRSKLKEHILSELVALITERDEALKQLEQRMLESKMIEHILDGDERWQDAIKDMQICPTMQSAIALKKQNEELVKDKEMLDWMDTCRYAHIYEAFKYHQSNASLEKTWRSAITAAMKGTK